MPALDVYNATDNLDETVLDVVVTRLEARGRHPVFAQMLTDYLDAMDIDTADRVLDIGCGSGIAARAIARRDGFSGEVLGIDLSAYLIGVAQDLASDEGLSDRIAFKAGDMHSLDIADESFDAVVAHTLFSHVDDPAAVLNEARRVVKPGGMIGIFDGDYASLTFEQDDPEKGQKDDQKLISAIVTNPRIMRQLPRLAKRAGLEVVASFPYVMAEMGRADYWVAGLESFRTLLARSGAMTEAEANAFVDAQLAASDQGTFFGASNYFGYVLKRP